MTDDRASRSQFARRAALNRLYIEVLRNRVRQPLTRRRNNAQRVTIVDRSQLVGSRHKLHPGLSAAERERYQAQNQAMDSHGRKSTTRGTQRSKARSQDKFAASCPNRSMREVLGYPLSPRFRELLSQS